MKWIPFNPDWQSLAADPVRSPDREAIAIIPAAAEASGLESKVKVVVAEDDAISREVVCTLLRNWGFDLLVASEGREAMEILRAQTGPVLAVLDWMMPGMDGLEICRRLRAADKLVYILLLTARSAKEQVVEGLQAGADDYLIKPFNKEELHARLKVGLRVLLLQATLAARVDELEETLQENRALKLLLPL